MDTDITLVRADAQAIDPMPADKGALGAMPLSAFQYCEAMRVASSLGWYIFPLKSLSLLFDGIDTFIAENGAWSPLGDEVEEGPFIENWQAHAPTHLAKHPLGWIRKLPELGTVQIWSGYLVSTAPGKHIQIRPLVNHPLTSNFYCYEGIVETDSFSPLPLFVNIKLLATHREIQIRNDLPLFQIVAVDATAQKEQRLQVRELFGPEGTHDTGFDWDGLSATLRIEGQPSVIGRYGASVRKSKRGG